MDRLINYLEKIVGAFVVVVLVSALVIYAISEYRLDKVYDIPLASINVVTNDDAIAEGERQARLRGCFWCHGEQLQGQEYFVRADRGIRMIAPNLTRKVLEYSDAELARAIRHGVKRDGTSVRPAMPSFAYYHLGDDDLGAIIAFIRSLPYQEGLHGEHHLWPIGRLRFAAGRLPPNMADLIDHNEPRIVIEDAPEAIARGRYLANTLCVECHGPGQVRVRIAPDLEIAASYTKKEFVRLLRTGIPVGEREIDRHMVEVAKYRYADQLTDDEIDALYAYFTSTE
jgi:mono/diheme cytochrome c family protein